MVRERCIIFQNASGRPLQLQPGQQRGLSGTTLQQIQRRQDGTYHYTGGLNGKSDIRREFPANSKLFIDGNNLRTLCGEGCDPDIPMGQE